MLISATSLGRDFNPDIVLTVPEQVDKLILQSTSLENLCQCFSGWFVTFRVFFLAYIHLFTIIRCAFW